MRMQALVMAVCVFGSTGIVWADAGPLTLVDNSWRLAVGGLHQDYQEQNPGLDPALTAPIVDQERGTVPQLAFRLQQATGGWYRALRLRYASGSDQYSGYACDPNTGGCTPDTTTTDNTIVTGAVRLGWVLGDDFVRTIPFATVGAWSWQRDVQGNASGAGVSEHYSFGYYGGGVLLQAALAGGIVWNVDGVLGETLQPSMTTQGVRFDLGTRTFWNAGTSFDMPLGNGLRLTVGGRYTAFGFGASPVYQSGNYLVQEPTSTTRQISYTVGIGGWY